MSSTAEATEMEDRVPQAVTNEQQSESVDDLRRRTDEIIRRADAGQKPWSEIYNDGTNFIFNNQYDWFRSQKKEDYPYVQANTIFPSVMQELAIIGQRQTNVRAEPRTGNDEAGAAVWTDVLRWLFERGFKVPNLLQRGTLDGKTNGHWLVKLVWEAKKKWHADQRKWEGGLCAYLIPAENQIMDHDADTYEDMEFIGTRRMVDVDWAKRRWPKYAALIDKAAMKTGADESDEIPPFHVTASSSRVALDGSAVDGEPDKGPAGVRNGALARLIGKKPQPEPDTAESRKGKPKKVQLIDLWIKDDTEKHVEENPRRSIEEMEADATITLDEDADTLGPVHRFTATGELLDEDNWPILHEEYDIPLFPNGRHVLRIGDTILNSTEAEQAWPLARWPFVIGLNHRLPHTWHGMNGVEMVRDLQVWLNFAWSHILNYIAEFSDPRALVEEGALQGDSANKTAAAKIKAAFGKLIRLRPGGLNKIQFRQPPTHSQGLFDAVGLVRDQMHDQQGLHDIGLGKQSKGGITATEATRLETNTRLRTGLQGELQDEFTENLMYLAVEMLQYYLEPGDILRIVGEEHGEQVLQATGDLLVADLDLQIESVTDLPYDQQRNQEKAVALYGIIGLPYLDRLLEAFEVKDAEELLQRIPIWMQLQEMIAQAEAAEQEAEAQPAGGGPPQTEGES
jgi:hypothetical protein